jgi:hypothetical protein
VVHHTFECKDVVLGIHTRWGGEDEREDRYELDYEATNEGDKVNRQLVCSPLIEHFPIGMK